MDGIVAIILLLLALIGISAHKTYNAVPARELKRRAAKHEPLAAKLYPVVAYGNSLRVLLWLYSSLTIASGFVLLAHYASVWVAILIVGVLLWLAFSFIPASRVTRLGTRLTVLITPSILWLLQHLGPLLSTLASRVEGRYVSADHTDLYEREDFLQLIDKQQKQSDNRLSGEQLELIKRSLVFDEVTVSKLMTPRKAIKTVLAGDTIGPVLIDELHKNGQVVALVTEEPKGPFVGVLPIKRLGIKSSGQVRSAMDPNMYYVHQNANLSEALRAFFATNYPFFLVVNDHATYVGIISIERILHELLGDSPEGEFDEYTNPEAVADQHSHASKEKLPSESSEKVVE